MEQSPEPVGQRPAHPTETAPPASAPATGAPSWGLLVAITILSAAADLASKWWAKANLSGHARVGGGPKRFEVIQNYLELVYAQNPGGAWSLLRGLPEHVRRPFFLFVSAAAIVFIVTIYRRVKPDQLAMRIGLPLALGGAIGNLVDRIRYGYVIDFIHAYVTHEGVEYNWPTFNVADIAICLGVGLMGVDMIVSSRRHGREVALGATPAEVATSSDRVPS